MNFQLNTCPKLNAKRILKYHPFDGWIEGVKRPKRYNSEFTHTFIHKYKKNFVVIIINLFLYFSYFTTKK